MTKPSIEATIYHTCSNCTTNFIRRVYDLRSSQANKTYYVNTFVPNIILRSLISFNSFLNRPNKYTLWLYIIFRKTIIFEKFSITIFKYKMYSVYICILQILWKYFSPWASIFVVWLKLTSSWIRKFVDFVFLSKIKFVYFIFST